MAQQVSIANFSEAERYVALENVFEYISDVATLASLTLVSRRAKSAVYLCNGLREIKLHHCLQGCIKVNGVHIKFNGVKRKEALSWLWTVGKRLRIVRLLYVHSFSDVLLLLNSLAATDKRRIETIEIRGMPCYWVHDLVRECRSTLRCLIVEWPIFHSPEKESENFWSLVQRKSESENFWSLGQQCKRLESFDISLKDEDGPIPLYFWIFLRETPLKHLSLRSIYLTEPVNQKFVKVLSCENLRNNLESLTLRNAITVLCFLRAIEELTSSHSPVFVNVTELSFCFLKLCSKPYPINWLAFWTVFPAVNKIKGNLQEVFHPNQDSANLSQNLSSFCKTYFDASKSRSRDIKIKISVPFYRSTDKQKLKAALAKAIVFPDDQEWGSSHSVHIENEMRDEKKVQTVTLRKDTSTLAFDFTYLHD